MVILERRKKALFEGTVPVFSLRQEFVSGCCSVLPFAGGWPVRRQISFCVADFVLC